MKTWAIMGGLCALLLISVATCADERALRRTAETASAEAEERHSLELAAMQSMADRDAIALAARASAGAKDATDAYDLGFALGSARCGL